MFLSSLVKYDENMKLAEKLSASNIRQNSTSTSVIVSM